jgi:hypothetical protein
MSQALVAISPIILIYWNNQLKTIGRMITDSLLKKGHISPVATYSPFSGGFLRSCLADEKRGGGRLKEGTREGRSISRGGHLRGRYRVVTRRIKAGRSREAEAAEQGLDLALLHSMIF